MAISTDLRRLRDDVGDLVAEHSGDGDLERFEQYQADPVGFARDVLGIDTLIPKQAELLTAVQTSRRTVVRGSNGAGKDFAAAVAVLHHVYARSGLALVTGPTERQVREVLMRREIRRAWTRAGDLPGELYEMALRIPGREQAGVLAFTATDPDRFTGHHAPRLLIVITEGQGVEDDIYEAAFACATGEDARLLVVGNPLRPSGRFYSTNGAHGWTTMRIAAADHPNVQTGREVVPGAVTREFVADIEREYGRHSPQFVARVLAEFPADAAEALVQRAWIDRAVALWRQRGKDGWSGRALVAVDVARFGTNRSAAAVWQQGGVRSIETWHGADTTGSADRVELIAEPYGRAELVIDESGLGGGLVDVLRSRRRPVVGFNGGRAATDPQRYANARTEAAWTLRRALESGRCPLPPDEGLREEILAHTWALDGAGRIALPPKEEISSRLRRSPDAFDAVSMAAWRGWTSTRIAAARVASVTQDTALTTADPIRATSRVRIGPGDYGSGGLGPAPGDDELAAIEHERDRRG